MKIKKFGEINESALSEYEKKAIKAGFSIGDKVFNKILKKNLTIVKNSHDVVKDKTDSLCTLGAVGESPDAYIQIDQVEKPRSDIKKTDTPKDGAYKIERIKSSIRSVIKNDNVTKEEMKYIIDELFKNID